ncbi:putative phosphoribosyl transferase Rv0571c/MT0597 [Parachlamydia acanthamoebae UV-7]|jgi:predicted phosphoribosyltransferase|uniref:Putative phosphoribosyl transferase Rv0571c/MT0597 n=2 Tax=Parachlamydia acanthamoebae TaxID=83552 RepID=F8L1D3_PARAV|nr:phosphoribosyltransferase family protein [Parachlamydia acanthamoebae]CCB87070.1 putative phosphoribosyl transferase Rv0571c/MT0597 [Parachlamydia acanthamoebae UV-7]
MKHFKDRHDAGRQLAELLEKYKDKDVIVYALPRGGVVIAEEIAKFLHASLDLIFAHKIGHPYQEEYAIAAISEHGLIVEASDELRFVDKKWFEKEKERQVLEMKRRRALYLKNIPKKSAKDKIAIIVDDGIATGLTMQAGIKELKSNQPKKIIAAVPVSPKSTAQLLASMVDEFVAIEIPPDGQFLGAVGAYYDEFYQVEDQEVIDILSQNS